MQAAALHRSSVEGALSAELAINRFRQTGSFHSGTGVRGHADIDLLVSLGNERPELSYDALTEIRDVLEKRFPTTFMPINRPAVVLNFSGQRWEVIPAFLTGRGDSDTFVYDIPSPVSGGGWIDTSPDAHLAYVAASNDRAAVKGGTKSLTRLLKAWKYFNRVPISSFYLEMTAALHMNGESLYVASFDLASVFDKLWMNDLRGIADPSGASGVIRATSSPEEHKQALEMVLNARSYAVLAKEASIADNESLAYKYASNLFNGKFPSR